MAVSTGLIITAGAITAVNDLFLSPMAQGKSPSWSAANWRIVPATAIAALALAGLDQLSPAFATGLAATALITVLFAKVSTADPPAENLDKILGYGQKVT
jgi:hypothetical protein